MSFHLGRDDPKINLRAIDLVHVVGLPLTEIKGVGNDARSRTQLIEQTWAQSQIDAGKQIHCDDTRLANFGLEQILHAKRYCVINARPRCIFTGLRNARAVDVHTEPARTMIHRGRDHDAPIPGAEIDQIVVRTHVGHVEHAVDDRIGSDDKGCVQRGPRRGIRCARNLRAPRKSGYSQEKCG